MAVTSWQVIARDPDLNRRGYLPYSKLTFDHVHQDVSTWSLELPALRSVQAKLGPGWGVIIVRDGVEILSGPMQDDGPRSWSASDDGRVGTITVTGGDDTAIVDGELAYPAPTLAAASQTGAAANDIRSGPAETVIKGYVGANVGTTRAAARGDADAPDVRLVTVATDLARGDTVQFTARWQKLTDIARVIAQAGSGLGWDVVQDIATGELVFDVYAPRDLSRRLRFSRETGNLIAASTTDSMPTLTHAVVLGQIPTPTDPSAVEDPSQQPIIERKDSDAAEAWRMIIRQTVDATSAAADDGTNQTAEMTQAGDAALADGRRQYATDVTIVETAQVRYPHTVRRGDYVTVIDPNRPGRTISDTITSVHVEVDTNAGTETVQLNVGVQDSAATGDDLTDLVKVLKRKVAQLERRTA